ncbi:hypothetical protein QJQ45_011234 [Haematococcus lacustris]|nr:hypothetical protein QJQ45_011234 [Haematococcus lacustris]
MRVPYFFTAASTAVQQGCRSSQHQVPFDPVEVPFGGARVMWRSDTLQQALPAATAAQQQHRSSPTSSTWQQQAQLAPLFVANLGRGVGGVPGPKWARQWLRLYGAQDRALEQFFMKLEEEMAEVAMKRHGRAKQLVVFFGAATIGTAVAGVQMRPRGTDQRRGRMVLVDEHRTSRVSSAVNGQQPCESRLSKRRATRPADWKPPARQVEQRLLRPAWSQQHDQPVRGLMWSPVVAPRN